MYKRQVNKCLKKGGLFVFEVGNQRYWKRKGSAVVSSKVGKYCLRTFFKFSKRDMKLAMKTELLEGEKVVHRFFVREKLIPFKEMKEMLKVCGFKTLDVYSDFRRHKFDLDKDSSAIVVCKKIKEV